MAKKVTMDDIANHLGISKFAVSKAISGKSGVSDQTRERVLQAAAQLGYLIQKAPYSKGDKHISAADELNSTVKPVVVVMMPNIRFQSTDSLYWGRILEEISIELDKKGVGMIIVTDFSSEHFLNYMHPQGLVGVICVGVMSTSLLLEIRQLSIPFILVDHEDSLVAADCIFINNIDSESRLVGYLCGLGHRSFLFIGNISYSRSFYDRWTGFRSTLEQYDIAVTTEMLLPLLENDRYNHTMEIKQWMLQKLAENCIPTALICANDAIAISTLEALKALQIKVPEEVVVCGFDDIEDAINVQPNLTTINVDKEAMGRRAVESLFRRIEQKDAVYEKILLSADLVIRESTGQSLKRSE
jgi:LacI family transcriptional regulator